jgi:uridine kinase
MKTLTVIGICGGSGSGKSTLAKRLASSLNCGVSIIRQDDYYKSNDSVPQDERRLINYDHPSAFDTELLISHLDALRGGKAIDSPIYDYTRHTRAEQTKKVYPTDVVILEGVLLFECEELLSRIDFKIFVDTDEQTRLSRRIMRDVRERGRTEEDVIRQYLCSVKAMHDAFVEPSRRHADLTVCEGGFNEEGLLAASERISALIK